MPNNPVGPGIYSTEILSLLTSTAVPGTATATFAAAINRGPGKVTLITSWTQFTSKFGTFSQVGTNNALHYAVYQFFNNGGSQCYVLGVSNTDAVLATHTFVDTNSPTDNVMVASAVSPGAWGNNIFIALTSAGRSGRFNLQVFYNGSTQSFLVENFIDLSINPVDPRYVANIVNSPTSGSSYITVAITLPTGGYVAGVTDPALVTTPVALTSGAEGSAAPTLGTAVPAALDTLQGNVLNVNLPGTHDATTINALTAWAAGRGDVIIIMDGPPPSPPQTSIQVAANYTGLLTGGSPINQTSYIAIYAPYIKIVDPASAVPGAAVFVPPGGAVLGVWSRTDRAVGEWQTPAGITYGQLSLVDIEAKFTATDVGNLTNANINPIILVPNYFPTIMGGRTLQQGYPNMYLSVRRTLMKLEHDFTYLLQPVLFAPNNSDLWVQITQILTNYLNALMQQNALGSTTQDTAFQITCDATNNTPATAQSGIVNVDVAVALSSPAEFIYINISQFQNTGTTVVTTTSTGGGQ